MADTPSPQAPAVEVKVVELDDEVRGWLAARPEFALAPFRKEAEASVVEVAGPHRLAAGEEEA